MKEKLIAMLKAQGVANPEAVAEALLNPAEGPKVLVDDGKESIFIPKNRLDAEIEKKKAIQQQLEQAQNTLKDLEGKLGGNQDALKDLELYKNKVEQYEKQLKDMGKSQAVRKLVEAYDRKPHDFDTLMKLIDMDKVVEQDGQALGLKEQLDNLVKSNPFLFKELEIPGPNNPKNPNPKPTEPPKASIGEELAKARVEAQAKANEVNFFK